MTVTSRGANSTFGESEVVDPTVFDLARILGLGLSRVKNLGKEEVRGRQTFRLAVVAEHFGEVEHGYQVTSGLQHQGYYACFGVPLILKY